ncbi:MAG: type II secretion system minor pseudopilin GspI [Lysobacteraceae bacterium]
MFRLEPRQRGFTLLEVLIALLVLSLSLVALVKLAGLQADHLHHQRESTLAQWVAANAVAELRLNGVPEIGEHNGQERMAGREWIWRADVESTDLSRLRRIEMQVFADAADESPVAHLTAFVAL